MQFESLPLVVNLDGALSRSNASIEAIIFVLLKRPQHLLGVLRAFLRGKLILKQYLAKINAYQPETLPLRPAFVSYLREERSSGRPLSLVTAAHQSVADAVQARLGLFQWTLGSSDRRDMTSRKGGAHLVELLPNGFAYAGHDSADLEIWRTAKSIVLVEASPAVAKRARALGPYVETELKPARVGIMTWLRAIRIHQWAKNLLLFIPLALGHRYLDATAVLKVAQAFLAFGLIASATYIVNDLSDLAADREHRTKQERPIAKGAISVTSAAAAALVLGTAGVIGAFLTDLWFGWLAVAYIFLTLSYSLRLKAIPLVDVSTLGVLYTLRIFMGMVLISSPISHWLLVFSLFFFYSLSMAKRHAEIVRANSRGQTDKIGARGYTANDEPFTLSVGISAGLAAVLVLFQYVAIDAYPVDTYRSPDWLWLVSFLVFLWLTRVWLKSHRGRLDDDPVTFALKDPPSLILGLLVVACYGLALL